MSKRDVLCSQESVMHACYKIEIVIVIRAHYIWSKRKCTAIVFLKKSWIWSSGPYLSLGNIHMPVGISSEHLQIPQVSEFSQRRLFCLRCKLFCCSVPHVCPLKREEKYSVQVSHTTIRKLHLCCVGKCGGMQQGRKGAHHTGCSHLPLVLVWVRCAPQSECTSALHCTVWITTNEVCRERESEVVPALSAYTRAHLIPNPASSWKSECFCTSELKCVLPTLWAAAAKCPAHVLFYESLASMRLYYYYSLS